MTTETPTPERLREIVEYVGRLDVRVSPPPYSYLNRLPDMTTDLLATLRYVRAQMIEHENWCDGAGFDGYPDLLALLDAVGDEP